MISPSQVIERWAAARNPFNTGDILYSSWGFDQVNVDFFEVTRVFNPTMVEIRELQQRTVRQTKEGFYVKPVRGSFARTSQPLRRRVTPERTVKIDRFSSAGKWDGKPKYQTSKLYGY